MFISLNLQPKNVCRAYELGQLFDEQLLVEKCLKVYSSLLNVSNSFQGT